MPDKHDDNRENDGRFKTGVSGNPQGRPRSEATRLRATLIERAPEVIETLLELALVERDISAMRLVCERILPALKPHSGFIELPEIKDAKTLSAKVEAVLSAIAESKITPDVGNQIIASIGIAARVEETTQLRQRIEAIELTLKPRMSK